MTPRRLPYSALVSIRMANEGIPFRSIQRILQLPEAGLERELELAIYYGELDKLPPKEWPVGSTRLNRRPIPLDVLQSEISFLMIASAFGLTQGQARILEQLIRHEICPRTRLYAALAGNGDPKIIDIHICNLRKRLSCFPQVEIKTHWGVGYSITREAAAFLLAELKSRYNMPIVELDNASVS